MTRPPRACLRLYRLEHFEIVAARRLLHDDA